jgi:DNA processing protein
MVEEKLRLTADDLAAVLAIESVKGFGPQKFKELHEAGVSPGDALLAPSRLPFKGKRGSAFQQAIAAISPEQRNTFRARAARQLARAHQHDAVILTYTHPAYPLNVLRSNNPVAVLYVRGDAQVLAERRAVACVGSRAITGLYAERHREFATLAAKLGYAVVSGFALGADSIGHEAAYDAGGRTVCVMPSGLDRPFPPENKPLWEKLLSYPKATMVSEFPFGTAASSLTLRKRNKLIVAAALGVLVSQSSAKGGAMNAYRFALEQRKPVATFSADETDSTSGNRLMLEAEPAAKAFPSDRDDEEAWKEWLRGLSSSI